jgi:hypothetical protein
MGLQGFERRLERLVEGAFARFFRSGLRPVEIGRRLTREMDLQRSVGVSGRTVVPNAFAIGLSHDDLSQFDQVADALVRELADAAREHARDEGYGFMGPVSVELWTDPERRAGEFGVQALFREGRGGAGAGSLVLPNNERVVLGLHPVTIGRMPGCDITLDDANVSRRHAEIRPRGDGFEVVDLGSTNGSRVNGIPITQRDLHDGDELTFGSTRMLFQAS